VAEPQDMTTLGYIIDNKDIFTTLLLENDEPDEK
jgi:hypothetical protein